MRKYFYSDGTNEFGPFTIEELKEKGVTRETSVWFHELNGWKKAGAVPELGELFAMLPPPIPQQNKDIIFSNLQASSGDKTDLFVLVPIAFWLALNIEYTIVQKFLDNWFEPPFKYFQFFLSILYCFVPIVFALSIKNKTFKTIGIVLSAVLSIHLIYITIGDYLL